MMNVSSIFSMERVLDLVRGAGLVTGHVVGQAVKMSIFRGSNFYDSETQLISEAFGRAVPIVLAEKIHPSLAQTLFQSTFPDPWDLGRIRPKMWIYQRSKSNSYTEILHNADPDSVVKTFEEIGAFEGNGKRRIAFITHGFIHDIDVDWLKIMKDACLGHEDMVVCLIGWGGGANIGVDRYDHAARNIEVVGCWLGNYLRQMRRAHPEAYLWGIGHSLGAHLMGFAGKCSQSFDRITALDPAGPNFEREFGFTRLQPTDAPIVDCIHTDGYAAPMTIQALTSPTNHYGTLVPMGTIDFYPNWGHSQPGCVTFSVIGSHNRAFELFTETISRPGKFRTNLRLAKTPGFMNIQEEYVPGEEDVEMGFHCEGGKGNYYIEVDQEDLGMALVFGMP